MDNQVYRLVLQIIALGWCIAVQPALAIDGDVEYSAPYIMVDPDTGQIVTVNPGPRLKAHEQLPEPALTDKTLVANTDIPIPVASEDGPSTVLPVILIAACLFMVITGFVVSKVKGSNKDSA